jgi:hypothetical protein
MVRPCRLSVVYDTNACSPCGARFFGARRLLGFGCSDTSGERSQLGLEFDCEDAACSSVLLSAD